jgi:hypothetical protein
MKKIASAAKGILNSGIFIFLLCLLIPLLFQSCATERLQAKVQASLDGNHIRDSGPSYPVPSVDKESFGFNLGVMFTGNFSPPEGYGSLNHTGSGNFYASTDRGPEGFYNNSKNNAGKGSSDFMNNLRFMGGIEFASKRSGDDGTTTTLNYLQVPLYALYQTQLSKAGTVFGGLGPYFAYGIGGSTTSSFNNQSSSFKSFDSTTGLKRFDAGLGLTAGYEIPNSFSFRLAYDFGLANIDRNSFGDKAQNRGISLNIGYPLDKITGKNKSQ